jgi:hypothetical protein
MYAMRKSMQWLAVASHVIEECGPYVTKPGSAFLTDLQCCRADGGSAGRTPPEWPELLHLYVRLRPGLTVFDWVQEYDVHNIGIDVRRFLSFGLIKVRTYARGLHHLSH